MSELYKIVEPVDITPSAQQLKKIASRLFLGNYGAVYPVEDRLIYEYQTGEHGGIVYEKEINNDILKTLKSGELSEEDLIDILHSK